MSEFGEPWKLDIKEIAGHGFQYTVTDASTESTVYSKGPFGGDYGFYSEELTRIVACVNALAGVPAGEIKRVVSAGKWTLSKYPNYPLGDVGGQVINYAE